MHTLSVQQLLDAGVFGGQPRHRETGPAEEMLSVELGKKAFAGIGARPCGELSPEPSPTPSPRPSPNGCPGGSLAACMAVCPSGRTTFRACVNECGKRCS